MGDQAAVRLQIPEPTRCYNEPPARLVENLQPQDWYRSALAQGQAVVQA